MLNLQLLPLLEIFFITFPIGIILEKMLQYQYKPSPPIKCFQLRTNYFVIVKLYIAGDHSIYAVYLG